MKNIAHLLFTIVCLSIIFINISEGQVNLSKGLVAFYPFNGNAKDASGNGHDGTVNNASLSSDRFGHSNKAYSFNGSQGITVSSLSNLGTTGATMSCWLKTTSTASSLQVLWGVPGTLYLNIFKTGYYVGVFDGSGGSHSSSNDNTTQLNTGDWYNITATNDGKTTYLYVNGSLENSYSDKQLQTSVGFAIAQYNSGVGTGYTGSIDDVRLYYRQLSDSEVVAIYQAPDVSFGYKNVCYLDTMHFTDSSTTVSGSTYLWNFGDSKTSSLSNPVHYYSSPGTYKVTLKITSPYGSYDTTSRYVTVYNTPIPSFSANASIQCFSSNQFNLFNTSSGTGTLSYTWNFGDGTTSNSVSATHSYNAAGAYKVTLQAENQYGCVDTVSQVMSATSAHPGFTINSKEQCLSGNEFDITNTTTGPGTVTYFWDFGDGSTSSLSNPKHSYSNAGDYSIRVSAYSGSGCVDTISQNIIVDQEPVAIISVNNKIQCLASQNYSFTGTGVVTTGKIVSWLWSFGDNGTSSIQNPTHVYSAAGSYIVKLTITSDKFCTSSILDTVVVVASPHASFSTNSSTQCLLTQNFVFNNLSTVTTGSLKYKWIYGDGSAVSTSQSSNHIFANVGNFTVSLLAISDYGCIDTFTDVLHVVAPPVAAISASGSTKICEGENVTLFTNQGSGYAFQWYRNGSKVTNAGSSDNYSVSVSGAYKVGISNGSGCSDTSPVIYVAVNPLPARPVITQSGRLLLSSAGTSYQWFLNDTLIKGANLGYYTPSSSKGVYSVSITDSNGCSNSSYDYLFDVSAIDPQISPDIIKIYPNPAHDFLNIAQLSSIIKIKAIQIVAINGNIAKIIDPTFNSTLDIPLTEMSKGIYFIRLICVDNTFVQKLIIE